MLLLWGGVAFGASAGSPPAGTWSGHYKVTIKITNTRSTPSHWIYAAQPRCSSLCRALRFRQRLASEKSWRTAVLNLSWNGKAYTLLKKFPKSADCYPKSGGTVKQGYDVIGYQRFNSRTVSKGRVTRWSGTGKDSYVLNAKGRAHHCIAGVYLYAFTGVAQ